MVFSHVFGYAEVTKGHGSHNFSKEQVTGSPKVFTADCISRESDRGAMEVARMDLLADKLETKSSRLRGLCTPKQEPN